VIFEHRTASPTGTKCALAALVGFGSLSLVNVIMQLRMMANLQTGGPARAWGGTIWTTWSIIHPLLNAACWALLLFSLVKAMRRGDKVEPHSDEIVQDLGRTDRTVPEGQTIGGLRDG
jgi:hypothetical protein